MGPTLLLAALAFGAPAPKGRPPELFFPTAVGTRWVYADGDREFEFKVTAVDPGDRETLVTVTSVPPPGRKAGDFTVAVSARGLVFMRGRLTRAEPYPL